MELTNEIAQNETIDFKKYFFKILDYWYLFLISILIAFAVAYYKNKSSIKIYEVKSSILLQTEQPVIDGKFAFGSNLINTNYFIFNEIGILKSYTLTQRAIHKLDFTVSYFIKNRFALQELYTDCPFIFNIDSTFPQPLNTCIWIKITSPTEFTIEIDGKNVSFYNYAFNKYTGWRKNFNLNKNAKIDKPFIFDNFAGKIIPRKTIDLKEFTGQTYCILLNNEAGLVNQFKQFKVNALKYSSILELSLQGNNSRKLTDFLNTILKEYLIKGLEKKNQIADNTIRFIDSQLGEVTDSLSFSEKRLQDYRASHAIMNVDFQTQQVYTSLEELHSQKAILVINDKYYDYLKKYLAENNDGQNLVIPSSMGIQDASITKLLNELTELYNEKWEIAQNAKKENPIGVSVDNRIKNFKKVILDNIESLKHANKISIQDLDQRIENLSQRMNKLPETERKLFGYERKFKFNDALYTFLLTKRSEVQISKASYVPDNEILDLAREDESYLIGPIENKNYLIALIFGFAIPLLIIVLIDFFNNKVLTNEDIEKATQFPIIGHVVHNKEKSYTVVSDQPLSLTAESIRGIRTNFQFVGKEEGKNVVMVTSSMMGEGKSYISLNLAISFALTNKKTVLINFDLRKPKLHRYLDLENTATGLSLFLSGNAKLEEVITKTSHENFDIILAGTIPPNPMELISGKHTELLINKLKETYDYIILDTPPVGMVADALLLVKFTDVVLYIVRQGYALKNVFTKQVQNLAKHNIPNVNIVLNDVKIGRKYYSYSYGYAYTYGYGYYEKKRKNKKSTT